MSQKNEIVVEKNWEEIGQLLDILTKNGYACLITLEDIYVVINTLYTGDLESDLANRDNVSFEPINY